MKGAGRSLRAPRASVSHCSHARAQCALPTFAGPSCRLGGPLRCDLTFASGRRGCVSRLLVLWCSSRAAAPGCPRRCASRPPCSAVRDPLPSPTAGCVDAPVPVCTASSFAACWASLCPWRVVGRVCSGAARPPLLSGAGRVPRPSVRMVRAVGKRRTRQAGAGSRRGRPFHFRPVGAVRVVALRVARRIPRSTSSGTRRGSCRRRSGRPRRSRSGLPRASPRRRPWGLG